MDKQPLSVDLIRRRVAEFKAMGEDHHDFETGHQQGTFQFGLWGLEFCEYLLHLVEMHDELRPYVKVIDRKDVRPSVQDSFTELKYQVCESDEVIDLGESVIEAQRERADEEEEDMVFSTHTEEELLNLLLEAKNEGYDYVVLS